MHSFSARRLIAALTSGLVIVAVLQARSREAEPPTDAATARWWADVEALASDAMQGRMTGSPEYRRAAEYVANAFKDAGLAPGGTDGYFQKVEFVSRQLVPGGSTLTLIRDGQPTPLVVGDHAVIGLRYAPSETVDAGLVFAGYGLSIPEAGYNDLAGLDLRGKIVVYVSGTPGGLPADLLSHAQSSSERWAPLAQAGAVGVISITGSANRDVPWARTVQLASNPTLRLADPALDEARGQQIGLTVNEAGAARLLEGTGQDAAALVALAARHEPLPRFAIPSRLQAHLVFTSSPVSAENVVGIRRGTDQTAAAEHVVLSAHLDHIGVGEPIDGDRIFNGAMDNASGIATLLEAARHTANTPTRRSLVFLAVTAEEQGLLGSRYFASNPTVPRASIVADVNVDMFLPLYPMKSVIGYGADESDLGNDLRRAAANAGVSVMADPEPARRSFIRSDQYSFIRGGIPSLALKLGYELGSPEHQLVTAWRTKRYHAPSDDLAQPVDRGAVAAFNTLYLSLVDAVANRPSRPAWNETSFFKRFETPVPSSR
jgi:hypothetical protein